MFLNPILMLFILFLGLVFGIIQLSWTPHYPATAEVFYQPKWVLIHSPVTGIMTHKNVKVGDKLAKGQKLLDIQPMLSLLHQARLDDEFQDLQHQIKDIHQEKNYQFQLLKHMKGLAQQKLIAKQELHELKQQYQAISDKNQQLIRSLADLKQKHRQMLQAPIAGTLVKYYVQEGELIQKDKKLVLIQPKKFEYWVQFHLPIARQQDIFIGQKVRLAWIGLEPFKAYPMQAMVSEISPRVHANQFVVKAKIINASDFSSHLWAGLSLDAYFLGVTRPLWQWMAILLKGAL